MRDRISEAGIDGKKQIVVLTAVIAMILVVLIDTSYAWYVVTKTSDKSVGIRAGNLDLVFENDSEEKDIVLDNLVPVTDTEGMNSEGYKFKITNTGSIASSYTIYLMDKELNDGEAVLDNKYIKYSIEKNSEKSEASLLSNVQDNIIGTGYLEKEETAEFTLRLWLDEDAFDKDAINKVSKKYIKISASQATDEDIPNQESSSEEISN